MIYDFCTADLGRRCDARPCPCSNEDAGCKRCNGTLRLQCISCESENQSPDIGGGMAFVFFVAWLADKWAWLTCKRWRIISRGNPK